MMEVFAVGVVGAIGWDGRAVQVAKGWVCGGLCVAKGWVCGGS